MYLFNETRWVWHQSRRIGHGEQQERGPMEKWVLRNCGWKIPTGLRLVLETRSISLVKQQREDIC